MRPEHLVGLDAEEAFVARYGAIFEHSPWVARAAFAEGPFAGVDDLHAAMVAAMREAPRERQLALIRAHPELAGREAQAGELTEASAGEQARAGLDPADRRRGGSAGARSTPPTASASASRSSSACASTPRPRSSRWGEERLGHEPEQEVEIALGEIAKIARLRLEELER